MIEIMNLILFSPNLVLFFQLKLTNWTFLSENKVHNTKYKTTLPC